MKKTTAKESVRRTNKTKYSFFVNYKSIVGKAFSISVIFIIHIYRIIISPILPPSCRYSPTCSEYAIQALKKHSVVTSIKLIIHRLSRCHPWSSFGYDPVP
ncbi:MAG: membrane protein insertion efficiency factor YidD [Candidatus Marinimicrobia bacterium]|nr:membrane protein insertion efficiency factor YidD [Candidatus Neomarinimicrobiota bacterium]